MATVWLISSGDYENYGVDGIAVSRQAAVDYIKAKYGPPYVVEWKEDGDDLIGIFENVDNYSVAHTCRFTIEEMDVQGTGS